MDEVGTKFMNLCGSKDTKHVTITAGCEQEYFLIDRAFYYQRPDLVMTAERCSEECRIRTSNLMTIILAPLIVA